MRSVEATFRASGVFRNSWKSRSLREDIGQSLLDYIVGASTNESRVLVDLRSGRIGEANRGADLFGLDDFE